VEPHLIASIVTLLLIACIVSIIAQRLKQPYTIALVVVGLLIAVTKLVPSIHISHDVTFTLILPPLLFYGALHMDLEHLRNHWKSIGMLAIPGVAISTLLIGFIIAQLWDIELIYALLFGALITPTDPISVLSILKKVNAPQRLRIILEGESLFNDGTGVVLFTIILGMITGGQNFQFGRTVGNFLIVTGGGAVLGTFLGYLTYRILKKLDDHLLEVAITVVLAFGTPLLAESLHLSGIIAVVVAGLIVGNYGKIYSMSAKTRQTLDSFWEVIDFIINSILFLVIGVELQVIRMEQMLQFAPAIGGGIFALLLSRLIVVYPVVWLRNKISREKIPGRWAHIFFLGGLRGSISIALVVGLPSHFIYRDLFLTVAFFIVLFTLVVQGLTMAPFVKALGLLQEEPQK